MKLNFDKEVQNFCVTNHRWGACEFYTVCKFECIFCLYIAGKKVRNIRYSIPFTCLGNKDLYKKLERGFLQ